MKGLFNLRGEDVPFNPVVKAYAIITLTTSQLYVDREKLSEETTRLLQIDLQELVIKEYHQIWEDLNILSTSLLGNRERVLLDPSRNSAAIFDCFDPQSIENENSPLSIPKAVKNSAEIEGFIDCSKRDSATIVKFLSWLENGLLFQSPPLSIDEAQASHVLSQLRAQESSLYVFDSFETIAAVDSNSAIVHYKPEPGTCAQISPSSLFLLDTGGQYL